MMHSLFFTSSSTRSLSNIGIEQIFNSLHFVLPSNNHIMEDPTRDSTDIHRKANHRWTVQQHIILAFLVRSYDNPCNDIKSVFNNYFSRDLRNPNGLSSAALASMYYDMQRGITGKEAMRLLQETAFSFVTLVDQNSIERTATKLGIHLSKRSIVALSTGTQPPKQQHSAKRKALVVDEDTDFLSEGEPAPRGPNKRQRPEPTPRTPDRHNYLGARNGS